MRIVAIASQKGGAGKTTFATNLASLADREDAPALLIDTNAQGALTRWHSARGAPTPLLVPYRAGELAAIIETAGAESGVEWVFIDTATQTDAGASEAIRAATLVLIPTRPGMFDLATVPTTIALARRLGRPFFVALNGVPPRHGVTESPIVAAARRAIRDMGAPVWRGAVAERAVFPHALAAGQAVTEYETAGPAADEMRQLWHDVSDAAHAMAQYREPAPEAR